MADTGWIEGWLSEPRFGVYLAAAENDRRLALALYDWNAAISSAFHQDLGHLEVGLRNAYDRALRSKDVAERGHWVLDPMRFFSPLYVKRRGGGRYDSNLTSRKVLERAALDARRSSGSPSPAPGKVIAETGFGFWRYLTAKRLHDRLWIPYLHTAFRPGTGREDVDRPVGRLHDLRNRVAHHEPLLTARLRARHDDVLVVAGLLSEPLRDHLAARSGVAALIDQRPR